MAESGNEIGPFRSVEESTLAQLTPFTIRTDIFAWYNLIGIVGQALGTIACGTVVQHLQSRRKWDALKSYRVVFLIYTVLGLIGACLAMFLSKRCEIEDLNKKAVSPVEPSEGSPLLQEDEEPMANQNRSLLPSIGKESVIILLKLSLLFMVDSIASGLVSGYVYLS